MIRSRRVAEPFVRARNLEIFVSRPNIASVASIFALCTLFVGCNSIPRTPGSAVRASDSQRLKQESPIEVAVAPIINASGSNMPTDVLRGSCTKELVEHHYSPLAQSYVDRKIVDAAYTPGAAQESATLQITVEKWDASLWSTHGAIVARIHASLIDATGGREVLWSATADQRFDFPSMRDHVATETARIQFACDTIAKELLARLPARKAVPGRL